MAVQDRFTMTAEEFDRFAERPENRDKRLEFNAGEVIDVITNSYASMIAASIVVEIGMFVKGKKLGRITGADGGYKVSGERYIPDAAFVSIKRQPEPSHELYNSNA